VCAYGHEREQHGVAVTAGVMVQDGGCGHVVNTRISGGRVGVGFSTQGTARVSNCTIAAVRFGVAIIVNRPAEVVMEDNNILAKMLVMSLLLLSIVQLRFLLFFSSQHNLCHVDNVKKSG